MRSLSFVGVLALAWLSPATGGAADTVFFIVRHAEKAPGNGDVSLSDTGMERAEQLKQMLEPLRVDAIYHTDFLRTRQTAKPLASKLSITPQVYTDHSQAWIDDLVSANQGKRVLIVGHSNTVHEIAGRLTGRSVGEVGDRFDTLFVVSVAGDEKALIRLTYGKSN
jgi:broad specificity phosphatase PhoE